MVWDVALTTEVPIVMMKVELDSIEAIFDRLFNWGESSVLCLLCGVESLSDFLPVDDLPHLVQEERSLVLVVHIVGVLPDVNVEQRHDVGDGGDDVLVGRGSESQLLLLSVVDQPAPSRPLDCSSLCAEHLLERLVGAKTFFDNICQLAAFFGRGTILNRAEGVPEELVVDMSTSVEAQGFRKLDSCLNLARCNCFRRLLTQLVVVVDVRSVMLTVVEVEGLVGDDGLKVAEGVGEMLELDAAGLRGGRGHGSFNDCLADHVVVSVLIFIKIN